MTGGEFVVKINPGLLTVPFGVVTDTLPEAPLPTTAEILVGESTEKEAALILPKLTAVAPVKLVPVMVTVAPLVADVGVKEVIVGVGDEIKVNPADVATPPGVVTETEPDVPAATIAVILVGDTTV